MVKMGLSKQLESNGFPNYFIAQKVRAKILNADEQLGNKELLNYKISQKKTVIKTDGHKNPSQSQPTKD